MVTIWDFRMMWEERRDDQEKLDDGSFQQERLKEKSGFGIINLK